MLSQLTRFHLYFRPSNIALCIGTTSYLSVHLLMDVKVSFLILAIVSNAVISVGVLISFCIGDFT